MFHIALYEPEIPPNTGNIIRLCANTGCHLHLIHPLGFELEEKQLRRAGLDYRALADVTEHGSYSDFLHTIPKPSAIYCMTTKGSQPYHMTTFQAGDIFLFGPETRGLPDTILNATPPQQRLRLPMQANSRSLNLSNSVAVLVYEALRQQNFSGLI